MEGKIQSIRPSVISTWTCTLLITEVCPQTNYIHWSIHLCNNVWGQICCQQCWFKWLLSGLSLSSLSLSLSCSVVCLHRWSIRRQLFLIMIRCIRITSKPTSLGYLKKLSNAQTLHVGDASAPRSEAKPSAGRNVYIPSLLIMHHEGWILLFKFTNWHMSVGITLFHR